MTVEELNKQSEEQYGKAGKTVLLAFSGNSNTVINIESGFLKGDEITLPSAEQFKVFPDTFNGRDYQYCHVTRTRKGNSSAVRLTPSLFWRRRVSLQGSYVRPLGEVVDDMQKCSEVNDFFRNNAGRTFVITDAKNVDVFPFGATEGKEVFTVLTMEWKDSKKK